MQGLDAFKIRNEDEGGINHRGNEQREKHDLALRIGNAALTSDSARALLSRDVLKNLAGMDADIIIIQL